jgi:hypothetical protein
MFIEGTSRSSTTAPRRGTSDSRRRESSSQEIALTYALRSVDALGPASGGRGTSTSTVAPVGGDERNGKSSSWEGWMWSGLGTGSDEYDGSGSPGGQARFSRGTAFTDTSMGTLEVARGVLLTFDFFLAAAAADCLDADSDLPFFTWGSRGD